MFRRATLLAFSFMLLQAGTPAFAYGIDSAPTFGRASCSPTFPCALVDSHDADRTIVGQLIDNANKCVASRLALRDPDGYFVVSRGLDSHLCLTTKPLPTATAGLTMTPRCCVEPTAKNPETCQIVCIQYGVK
ncbi:MAG: hypothetical protein PHW63_07175 [Alphaproteobacteria bacterium]|nr:hypothetical protein [Alphaproteobacteria bacterium]